MNAIDPTATVIIEGIKVVGQVVPDVYRDAVQPTAQASGHALGILMNVFNLLLAPLERAQIRSESKTERLRRELAKGFEEIPIERQQEPPLEIIGPALETLKYVEDEVLQNMFVKLLLSSMNSETQSSTHQAFVKIISELSSFDAAMLKRIYAEDIRYAYEKNVDGIGIICTFTPPGSYTQDEILVQRSLDNFERLNLIRIVKGYNVVFMGDARVLDVNLTRLGHDFCRVCIK